MDEILKLKFVLSEKSASYLKENKYVFEVIDSVNKIEVKKYISKKYNVDILAVNSMNYLGKKRRRGRISGKDSDYKKVIVTLKDGQEIREFKDLF